MKQFVLFAFALLVLTSAASAQIGPWPRDPFRNPYDPFPCRFGNCIPGDRWGDRWPGDRWPDRDRTGGGGVACAPEVVEGNVKATDRTLVQLASTSDFANAKTFKAQVSKIASLKDSGKKATKYFALVGIDARDSAAVVEFIGARQAKGQWLTALERNSELTSRQAETVATKLQTVLRGGLN